MKGYPDSYSLLENTSVIFDDIEPAAQALVNQAPSPLSWQVPAHSLLLSGEEPGLGICGHLMLISL